MALFNNFKAVWGLYDDPEKRTFKKLIIASALVGLFEMLSVCLIGPFIAVSMNIDSLRDHAVITQWLNFFHLNTQAELVVACGSGIIMAICVGNYLNARIMSKIYYFCYAHAHALSLRLYGYYLHQGYAFFTKSHSADLTKRVLPDIQVLLCNVLVPTIALASKSLIVSSILVFLLFLNWKSTILLIVYFGIAYALCYLPIKGKILSFGLSIYKYNSIRYKTVNESFLGIKDVKSYSLESFFQKMLDETGKKYSDQEAGAMSLSFNTRYTIEAITVSSAIAILTFLNVQNGSLAQALPLVAMYILAGYRLLPNVQALLNNFSLIKTNTTLIAQTLPFSGSFENPIKKEKAVPFFHSIELNNAQFFYEKNRSVFKNLNLTIHFGEAIGIIGTTGSGKTTIIDIIAGLLPISSGSFTVDGVAITENNLHAWMQNIAIVSQKPFLLDGTVAENIAFGGTHIDYTLLREAAQKAQILADIEKHPEGFNANCGEGGVKFSGGQVQRLAIARAFYHQRKVLILDEGTSALDSKTEDSLLETISKLKKNITLILVTHRPKALDLCDNIYKLKDGALFLEKTKEKT